MEKTVKKILKAAAAGAAVWAAAVKPRILHRPDFSVAERYDYAERGGYDNGRDVPENSARAIRAAIERGYGMILDVRVTSDGIPVLFHDSSLVRLCGVNASVENAKLSVLRQGTLLNTEEKILTLREALRIIDGQVPVILNLITELSDINRYCDSVCDEIDSYTGEFAIQSSNIRVLRWFYREREEYKRGFVMRGSSVKNLSIWDRMIRGAADQLLLNLFIAPDYISVNVTRRYHPSLRYCRLLYRVHVMYRGVKDLEEYEIAKMDGALVAFDGIKP